MFQSVSQKTYLLKHSDPSNLKMRRTNGSGEISFWIKQTKKTAIKSTTHNKV